MFAWTLLAAAAPAHAQENLQALWQGVLADPANTQLGYRFANALVGAGRYDEAAAELERLLIIQPDQPQIKLELGVVYFRLQNYDLARAYLEQTLHEPELTAAVRERVEYFLGESRRLSSRSQVAGSISLGGRFQSNANGGTEQSLLSSSLVPVPVTPNLRSRSDVNAFITGELSHSYDLELQREAAIVTSVGALATRQTDPYFYNLSGITVRSGVRFAVAPETIPGLTLYPYGLSDFTLLNDKFYNLSGGAGGELSLKIATNLTVSLIGEGKASEYDSVPKVPTAKALSGDQELAQLSMAYRPSPTLALFAQLGGAFFNTRQAFYSYNELEATAGFAVTYPGPLRIGGGERWNLTLSGSYFSRPYGGPDPAVSLVQTRKEREWRLLATNYIPVTEAWSWFQSLEYRTTAANIANYNRDNILVSIGVTRRF